MLIKIRWKSFDNLFIWFNKWKDITLLVSSNSNINNKNIKSLVFIMFKYKFVFTDTYWYKFDINGGGLYKRRIWYVA